MRFFVILILTFMSFCHKMDALDTEPDNTPQGAIIRLNMNVEGLQYLAESIINCDSVAVFNINYNSDGSVLYWLSMKEGGDIELYSEIVSMEISVPELSITKDGDVFFWMINGNYLFDLDRRRVAVTDRTKQISFQLQDESVQCIVNQAIVGEYPATRAEYLAKDVYINYDIDSSAFNIRLSSGFQVLIPTVSDFNYSEKVVINQSYYKDVFLDAGIALTSRKSLAAADYLNLSVEGISFSSWNPTSVEKGEQLSIVGGDSNDNNGRLLYPDGQPRYKLIFVNGGKSIAHGSSLWKEGLENMRLFVKNGGCYVGTCAGAFLASNGFDGVVDYPYYLSIWPGTMRHTGLSNVSSGMFIEKNSPLLDYYDYGGDYYVDSIRHNTGGYPDSFPLRTEILARYDYPKNPTVHRKPSIWAYKEPLHSGRVVLEGSHPEEVPDGERRDLTAAMMLYAMDGVGIVSLKGYLKNGEVRVMDKKTTDNDPAYTRIGDLQTHHFAAYIPSDAKNIQVEVTSSSKCDLALMMDLDTYAFSDTAEYRTSGRGGKQQLHFNSLREGFWYISVQCLTTVTVEETDYGQAYTGNLEVLNGIPYSISISWE